MSTSQKYVGGGNNAPKSSQTAQNDVSTPIPTDERPVDFTPENVPETPVPVRGATDSNEIDFDIEETDFDDLDEENDDDSDDDDEEEEFDGLRITLAALEETNPDFIIPRWQFEQNEAFTNVLGLLVSGTNPSPGEVITAIQDAFDYGMAFRHPGTAHIELGITTDGETDQSDVELVRQALSSYQQSQFAGDTDQDATAWIQIDDMLNKVNQEVVRDFAVYGDTETQDGQGVAIRFPDPLRLIDPQGLPYHPSFMKALQTMPLHQMASADKLSEGKAVLSLLRNQGEISWAEERAGRVLAVNTNGLFPQLGIGGVAVGIPVAAKRYGKTSGIVAIETLTGRVAFGRIGMGNSTSIYLLADLPGFKPVRVARTKVKAIYRIIHSWGHPTL